MKLTVPYIYEALIIKPRCRKPTLVHIKDSVDVDFKVANFNEMPVGMEIGELQLHWKDGKLWERARMGLVCNDPVTVDSIVRNTLNPGTALKSDCSDDSAPFSNFWHKIQDCICEKHGVVRTVKNKHLLISDESVITEVSSIEYKTWVADNRKAVEARAHQIAASIMVVDGVTYKQAAEPFYSVISTGNKSSDDTILYINYSKGISNATAAHFSATELDKARAHACSVAEKLNQSHCVSAPVNCGNYIRVLIDDAVQFTSTSSDTDNESKSGRVKFISRDFSEKAYSLGLAVIS